ncbi:MAG: QueT transporter family protein [Clostridiaceae bacterium]|nr:QueT transporter family protein [Clostridiaceae bacterium]
MNKKVFNLALAGVLAALYIILTLPFAQFAFGMVQFRLAEILTVLPILTPAAIPGVFIGCLLANFLNPQNLGLIDILGGSLTTLVAAYLTWKIGKPYRQYVLKQKYGIAGQDPVKQNQAKKLPNSLRLNLILALLPPILLNGLVVGTYLPFLLTDGPDLLLVLGTILSVSISQAIVILGIGMPLLILLSKNKSFQDLLA